MVKKPSPNLVSLILPVLLLLAGCAGEPAEKRKYDSGLLQRMGDVRTHTSGHALLTSRSGLMLCQPFLGKQGIPEWEPVDGLYLGSLRVLESWLWTIESAVEIRSSQEVTDRIRPDRFERVLGADLVEYVTIHPDDPVCLIELDVPAPAGGAAIEFHFDLRPVGLTFAEAEVEYDPEREILLYGNRQYGYAAVRSTGDWIDAPRSERVEYRKDFPPLDAVATVDIPGSFQFAQGDEVQIVIAVASTADGASHFALEAFNDPEGTGKDAAEYVLEQLNRAPLFCADPALEAAFAWDRWLLASRFSEINRKHFIPAPPLGHGQDPVADARALPAWFWATAGDTAVESILDPFLAAAMDSLSDIEGLLFALNGWSDWLELTGRRIALQKRMEMFAGVLNELGVYAKNNKKSVPPLSPARWEARLENTGIPHPSAPEPTEFNDMFDRLLIRALRWDQLDRDWRNIYKKTTARSLVHGIPTELPYSPILKNDPFVWGENEREALQEAKDNPRFNLGYLEYSLHADRDNPKRWHIGRLADRLWKTPYGYRFKSGDFYRDVVFSSPSWLVHTVNVRESGEIGSAVEEAMRKPVYDTWLAAIPPDTIPTWSGESPESIITVSERIRFLYEVLLGLQINKSAKSLFISPAGKHSFWESKAITARISVRGEPVDLAIDPFEGEYRVNRPGGDDELRVQIRDVPVRGERLSIEFAAKRKGETVISRKVRSDGKNTLLLNGHETMNVERRNVRRK